MHCQGLPFEHNLQKEIYADSNYEKSLKIIAKLLDLEAHFISLPLRVKFVQPLAQFVSRILRIASYLHHPSCLLTMAAVKRKKRISLAFKIPFYTRQTKSESPC